MCIRDRLGVREPDVYGKVTYQDLESMIEDYAANLGAEAIVLQSNGEGEIIDFIHHALGSCDALVINLSLIHISHAYRKYCRFRCNVMHNRNRKTDGGL